MTQIQIILCTLLALIAFAGNSIITRAALETTSIDEASFTLLRVLSGALFLAFYLACKNNNRAYKAGSWLAAFALFVYAVSFSYGYDFIAAGTGALILFGSVQITMTLVGYQQGERLNKIQVIGFVLAIIGLVTLLLPGIAAPSLIGAALMCISGIAWGIYTLLGRAVNNASAATAGNFIKAAPMAIILWLMVKFTSPDTITLDNMGAFYALLSGVVTSGMGYILWYSVLPELKATQAAILQLSVPLFVTLAGALLLNEAITLRVVIAAIAILLGTVLVLKFKQVNNAATKKG